jgi:hypothetical protein
MDGGFMATATVNTSVRLIAATAALLGAGPLTVVTADDETPGRVEGGLVVLYDFAKRSGDVIHDRSGVGEPLDLAIEKPDAVRWSNGVLTIQSPVLIATPGPARKVIDPLTKSNALTIEAWVRPANDTQGGPARIVSLSADTGQRNFTLGQEKDAYDVRLRATGSDRNGMPSTSSPIDARRLYARRQGGGDDLHRRQAGRQQERGRQTRQLGRRIPARTGQ